MRDPPPIQTVYLSTSSPVKTYVACGGPGHPPGAPDSRARLGRGGDGPLCGRGVATPARGAAQRRRILGEGLPQGHRGRGPDLDLPNHAATPAAEGSEVEAAQARQRPPRPSRPSARRKVLSTTLAARARPWSHRPLLQTVVEKRKSVNPELGLSRTSPPEPSERTFITQARRRSCSISRSPVTVRSY